MLESIAILFFFAVVLGAGVYASRERDEKRRRWKALAAGLGGSFSERRPAFEISARYEGYLLVIRERYVKSGKSSQLYTDLLLTGHSADWGIPRELSVSPEGAFGLFFTTSDIRTGDAEFDRRMVVKGRDDLAAAVLRRGVRDEFLRSSSEAGVKKLESGTLGLVFPGAPAEDVIRDSLGGLKNLADRLSLRETEIPARILENFLDEPTPSAARFYLERLLESYPEYEATRKAIKAAASHVSAEIRLFGALHAEGDSPSIFLEGVRRKDIDSELRKAAILRFKKVPPSPEIFAALFEVIEDSEPESLRLAALQVLGKTGTRECVERILPFTEGLLADGDVKRAAREAVEKIQSRLGNAEAGRISVVNATDEAGRISVAEIPEGAGRIAVVEKENGA